MVEVEPCEFNPKPPTEGEWVLRLHGAGSATMEGEAAVVILQGRVGCAA